LPELNWKIYPLTFTYVRETELFMYYPH
jgi:hypothetical protein